MNAYIKAANILFITIGHNTNNNCLAEMLFILLKSASYHIYLEYFFLSYLLESNLCFSDSDRYYIYIFVYPLFMTFFKKHLNCKFDTHTEVEYKS